MKNSTKGKITENLGRFSFLLAIAATVGAYVSAKVPELEAQFWQYIGSGVLCLLGAYVNWAAAERYFALAEKEKP